MSMLQEFFVYLSDLFQETDGALDPETVKERLREEGYDDVTAYDVREAVNLMYDEGDVFSNEQSSSLEAYTGGNVVDQSFNASGVGTVTAGGGASAGGNTSGGSPAATSGGAPAPAHTAPPPPPPMDPMEGYTDLDAAVEQIVYVSNITNNNTTNVTTINDQDTFEDNDTIVDASVNQTILGAGDVNQDFDTVTQGDNAIGVTGTATDANLVTGDNDGVIADDISDSAIVDGDNTGIVAGDDATGAAVGDGNVTGDGNAVGDGASAVNLDGDNDGVIETGEGDAEAIVGSNVGAAGFGDGDTTIVAVEDSNISEAAFQTGEGNTATVTNDDTTTIDNSVDNSITNDNDLVDIDIVEDNVAGVEEAIPVEPDPDAAAQKAQDVDPGGDDGDMADMAGA